DPLSVVPHQAGLPVTGLRRANDAGAECDGRALQSQADTQGRDAARRRLTHQRRRTTRDLATATPARDDHPLRPPPQPPLEPRIPGANHVDLATEPEERLRQVERERVVVADDQDFHSRPPWVAISTARRSARAFARVSASSAAGSESATMPAPAWIRHTPSAIVPLRMVMQVSSAPSNPTSPPPPPYPP